MALKYFTNFFKGNSSDSIAINPEHVASVYEGQPQGVIDFDTAEKKTIVTNIFCVNGTLWQVEDSYLDVVARLNERD